MSDLFVQNYIILNKLNQGRYGSLFKVIHKETKQVFALKIIDKFHFSQQELTVIKNEVRVL